jgi:flagellar biosynthesis GTPase FlhF
VHFEEGHCAKCGGTISFSAENAEWNDLSGFYQRYAKAYFCSPTCRDSAVGIPRLRKEHDEQTAVEIKREVRDWLDNEKRWKFHITPDEEEFEFKSQDDYQEYLELKKEAVEKARVIFERRRAEWNEALREAQETYRDDYDTQARHHRDEQMDKWLKQNQAEWDKKKREEEREAMEKQRATDREIRENERSLREQERREEKARREELAEAKRLEQDAVREAARLEEEAEQLHKEKLLTPVPLQNPPDKNRFEHTHILAPSGSGKSTLIENIILQDLNRSNPPGMLIIDPKGTMVANIARLHVFNPENGRLRDRLIILDTTDTQSPPALNMFVDRDAAHRNQIISLLEYVFSSKDFKLTQKQSVGFAFLARLMFAIPEANLHTFLDVVDERVKKMEQSQFAAHMMSLDATAQRFFKNDFYDEFSETKGQIKSRLYMILKSTELDAIFNARSSTIDWYQCIQERKIVLVNTGMDDLGQDASQLFGRYIIASVIAAGGIRRKLPDDQKPPFFVHIDEAQLYVDENKTQEMLSIARDSHIGCTLAHQQMVAAQLTDNIRNSISTNTSIKFAAAVASQDLNNAARDLRCEPEFIANQDVRNGHANFACFMRRMGMQEACTISAPIGARPLSALSSESRRWTASL